MFNCIYYLVPLIDVTKQVITLDWSRTLPYILETASCDYHLYYPPIPTACLPQDGSWVGQAAGDWNTHREGDTGHPWNKNTPLIVFQVSLYRSLLY